MTQHSADFTRTSADSLNASIETTARQLVTPMSASVARFAAEYSRTRDSSPAGRGLVARSGPAAGRTAGGAYAARWSCASLRTVVLSGLRPVAGLPPPPSPAASLPRGKPRRAAAGPWEGGRLRSALPSPPSKARAGKGADAACWRRECRRIGCDRPPNARSNGRKDG
jgi:hypothetical protein